MTEAIVMAECPEKFELDSAMTTANRAYEKMYLEIMSSMYYIMQMLESSTLQMYINKIEGYEVQLQGLVLSINSLKEQFQQVYNDVAITPITTEEILAAYKGA